MKTWWPWTSVARLRDAQAEIGRLRGQNAELIDALTRMTRVQQGLSETPREPREPEERMPKRLLDYVAAFGSPDVRRSMRNEAYRRHRKGEPWIDIVNSVMEGE